MEEGKKCPGERNLNPFPEGSFTPPFGGGGGGGGLAPVFCRTFGRSLFDASALLLEGSCLGERWSKPSTSFWTVVILLPVPPRSRLAALGSSCFCPAQKVFKSWTAWILWSRLDRSGSGVSAGLEGPETDPPEEQERAGEMWPEYGEVGYLGLSRRDASGRDDGGEGGAGTTSICSDGERDGGLGRVGGGAGGERGEERGFRPAPLGGRLKALLSEG